MLKDKFAVLTGSNGGLGLSILEKFAQNSCNVITCTRKIDKDFSNSCELIKKKYSIDLHNFCFDLENEKEVISAANEINSEFSNIDILINNAGTNLTSLIQMTKLSDMHKIFQINFFSVFAFTQVILKNMVRNKNGTIVNISSSAASNNPIGRSIYSASKSSLEKFSKTISKEYSAFNIRSNVIAPGLVNTKMMKTSTNEKNLQEVIKNLPSKRIGNPEEIADLAIYLASEKSNYINGQIIRVDGGMI
jgi:3-oxoacyl-[acyl-carrier protein] reductase